MISLFGLSLLLQTALVGASTLAVLIGPRGLGLSRAASIAFLDSDTGLGPPPVFAEGLQMGPDVTVRVPCQLSVTPVQAPFTAT